jgi:hypothetical protein
VCVIEAPMGVEDQADNEVLLSHIGFDAGIDPSGGDQQGVPGIAVKDDITVGKKVKAVGVSSVNVAGIVFASRKEAARNMPSWSAQGIQEKSPLSMSGHSENCLQAGRLDGQVKLVLDLFESFQDLIQMGIRMGRHVARAEKGEIGRDRRGKSDIRVYPGIEEDLPGPDGVELVTDDDGYDRCLAGADIVSHGLQL